MDNAIVLFYTLTYFSISLIMKMISFGKKYTSADMLGRVTSLDYLLATIAGSFSTFMTGLLQDNLGLGDRGVCVLCMSLGTCVTVYWFFHYFVFRRVD